MEKGCLLYTSNDVVCHGIPSSDVILKDGDIINVDATSELNGYYADASRMFMTVSYTHLT